jgi:hypothetical protein
MYYSKWSSIESFVDASSQVANTAIFEVFYQINAYSRFRNELIFPLAQSEPQKYTIAVLKGGSFSYVKSKMGKKYWYLTY